MKLLFSQRRFFDYIPAVGVSCHSSGGESSPTVEIHISDLFKGSFLITS